MIAQEDITIKASESKPFSEQSGQKTSYKDLSSLNTADFKNTNFFKQPKEMSKAQSKSFDSLSGQQQNNNESPGKDPDTNMTPQTSENEETTRLNSSPNPMSSPSSPYSGQQVNSFQESTEEMTNWNNTLETNNIEMSQSPYAQGEMSQVESNLNATSRFSFENFSLQSYSSESSDDINQQATQNIPIGDFDPQYYAASLKGRTNQNADVTRTPTSAYDNYDSQPYSDGTPFFPDGESDFFPDGESNFFPDVDSTMQSYSAQNGQTMPMQYGNPNSETYSTSPFDYGNSNSKSYFTGEPFTQEMIDSTGNPGFPDTSNNGFQPYSDSQTMSTQEQVDSNGAPQYNYGNTNPQSYSNTEATQTNGINPAPAFPNNVNSNSQSYPNGQEIQTTERIESTGTNGFANDVTSINQSGGSSNQQVGAAFVNSYAESLVSGQRGNSGQQSGDGGNESSKQTNGDDPSAPTTYAEYMQQRQEEQ